MNFRFSGININSEEPQKTFEFYKKLGFRITETAEVDNEWYGATFALEGEKNEPQIWIWRRQEGDKPINNQFVFDTDNKLDELYEQFKEAGIDCKPPITAEWGGRELLLTDPDGNTLLFL